VLNPATTISAREATMAAAVYRHRSAQLSAFHEHLRAVPSITSIQTLLLVPTGDGRMIGKLLVSREGKSPVLLMFVDSTDDGFELYYDSPYLEVDQDVALIRDRP
jgi:hypothetical protein